MPPPRQRPLDRASSSSDSVCDDGELDDEELLQLSSSDSSAGPSPTIPKLTLGSHGDSVDEISKDLAELEQLRKSVQTNLRLRPIRSKGKLPKLDLNELGMRMPGAFPMSARLMDDLDAESPAASDPSTSGLRPTSTTNRTSVQPPTLAHTDNARETASIDGMAQDRRAVGGMSLHAQSVPSPHSPPTASSSANMIPTGSKPKLKHKIKGPPPALVLSHSSTSTTQSGSPLNLPDVTPEGQLMFPTLQPPVQIIVDSRPASLTVTTDPPLSATSPTSSILSSYFTPGGDTPITSRFIGAYYSSPVSAVGPNAEFDTEESSSANATVTPSPVVDPLNTTHSSLTTSPNFARRPTNHQPQPIPAADLYARLTTGVVGQPKPLVIDTRAPAAHVANRIRGSFNIAIPSLILKRWKKSAAAVDNSDLNPSPNIPNTGFSAPQTGGGKGGFQCLESLGQFVVGEKAKSEWSKMVCSLQRSDDGKEADASTWDGDIIVCDEEMEQDAGSTAWILIDVLMALTRRHGGRVDYLEGGIMKGIKDAELEKLIDIGPMRYTMEEERSAATGGRKFSAGGLFQLDTKKKPSDIEISSTLSSASTSLSSNPTSPGPFSISHSSIPPHRNTSSIPNVTNDTLPKPLTSIPVHVIHEVDNELDPAPSPPPSSLIFRPRNPPQVGPPTSGLRGKRPSVPNLRKIDTTAAEHHGANPPKLSVRTKPIRSATLTVPPRLTLPGLAPASPSHLNLAYSSHSPPASARYAGGFGIGDGGNFGMTPYYTPPHTPKAMSSFHGGSMSAHPSLHGGHSSIFGYNSGADSNPGLLVGERQRDRDYPPSPLTARPEPPSTESETMPTFTISTILPNFLFLGPELTELSHVEELKELGVKRILNIAIECNEDDFGLNLKERFRYVKIPMRDTVEEENVQKGVRQACEILDDARLHSAATYVHCKAGKSRSVTAVMAYLIHANHWTLSRAYGFVLERRKGISPNIGFVSELMSFEEQELGGKSIGVQSNPAGGENGEGSSGPGEDSSFGGMNLRRGGHVRESLPPLESFSSSAANNSGNASGTNGAMGLGGPASAGGIQIQRVLVGDQAQEMEVKDASGRYRHARRAPVDENTLQPLRRVSKAGLESSAFEEVPRGERGRGGEREAGYGA